MQQDKSCFRNIKYLIWKALLNFFSLADELVPRDFQGPFVTPKLWTLKVLLHVLREFLSLVLAKHDGDSNESVTKQ